MPVEIAPTIVRQLRSGLSDEDMVRLGERLVERAGHDGDTDLMLAEARMMGIALALNTIAGRRTCRICGCWELHACEGGCSWSRKISAAPVRAPDMHPPPADGSAMSLTPHEDIEEFDLADKVRVACGLNGGVTLKLLRLDDQVIVAGGLDTTGARRLAAELIRAADLADGRSGGLH